jgi:hypothetical protein
VKIAEIGGICWNEHSQLLDVATKVFVNEIGRLSRRMTGK